MNKVIAGALTFALTLLGFIGLSFATIAPASAGNDKVFICHANESENGNGTGFLYKEVSKDGTANGHAGESHQNGDDIIPSFYYIEKVNGVNHELFFPGQNTTKTEGTFTQADCPSDEPEPETITASPVPPTYVPATCAKPELPYGYIVIPTDLGTGVASASAPVFGQNNATLSTTYTLVDDSDTVKYIWEDINGREKTFTFNTVHISSDPNYLINANGVGECRIANTGLFGLSDEATYLGGGLLALGALFVIGNAVTRRRTV